MPAPKTEELRQMTDEDLVARLKENKEELFNLRFQSATGQLENHGRLRAVKKDIARLLTEQRARQIAAENSADAQ